MHSPTSWTKPVKSYACGAISYCNRSPVEVAGHGVVAVWIGLNDRGRGDLGHRRGAADVVGLDAARAVSGALDQIADRYGLAAADTDHEVAGMGEVDIAQPVALVDAVENAGD